MCLLAFFFFLRYLQSAALFVVVLCFFFFFLSPFLLPLYIAADNAFNEKGGCHALLWLRLFRC